MAQARNPKDHIIPHLVETTVYTAGYHDKLRQDEIPQGAATRGSYNFILDKDGKWTTRGGSRYLGTRDALTGGITSSRKLLRRDGTELPIVFFGTRSKYFHPATTDWVILETGLTSGAEWGGAVGERSTDNMNFLVLGNAQDNYRYWSGATARVSSSTVDTVVVTGTVTLANLGFTATGSFSDNGTIYTYTGLSAQTFTGVTPDSSGITVNAPIAQSPVNSGSLPIGNVLASYGGRIVMFNRPSSALNGGGSLVGSQLNNYTTFAFASPRVASEGYQLIMADGGGQGLGLVNFEGGLLCLKQNAISFHQVTFDANDAPSLRPFLPFDETMSGHIGTVGRKAHFALRNQVFMVTPRRTITSIQRVSQMDYPQALPFSDRIQETVDDMGWDSETCSIGFDYMAIFCGKADPDDASPNKQLIYDQRYDSWWTPITGQAISSYFVYGGNLYGTLADSPDIIRLFIDNTDFHTTTALGIPINAKLVLGKDTFGTRSSQKKSRRLFLEGWMSKAGKATFKLSFNDGDTSVQGILRGTEDAFFFDIDTGGTFGVEVLGVDTFGGSWEASTEAPPDVGHFRILLTYIPKSFWNQQLSIETSSYFKLLNHAFDPIISNVGMPGSLKKAMA